MKNGRLALVMSTWKKQKIACGCSVDKMVLYPSCLKGIFAKKRLMQYGVKVELVESFYLINVLFNFTKLYLSKWFYSSYGIFI